MPEITLATVDDVNARRPEPLITDGERARAQALIDDATEIVLSAITRSGRPVGRTVERRANALRAVVCAMVNRAYVADDVLGVKSESETIGPVTQQYSYQNPTGDLYLTAAEKSLLGIGGARMGTIAPNIRGRG